MTIPPRSPPPHSLETVPSRLSSAVLRRFALPPALCVVAVGLAALTAAAPAAAAGVERGWYAGGGVSLTNYREPDAITDLSVRGLAGTPRLHTDALPWQLFFGYRGAHLLGFEAEYLHLDKQVGKLDLTAPVGASVDSMQETDGFSLQVNAALPLTRVFSLVGSGGFYIWHIESTAYSLASQTAVSATVHHRGVGPRLGVAVEAIVSARSTFRVGWQLLRVYNHTANLYTFEFAHYFGG